VDHEHDSEGDHDPHAWVGLSLITGFILMYLIDTLPRHATSSTQPQRFHISLNQFSFNRSRSVSAEEPPTPTIHGAQEHNHSRPSSTTVGLVIHAAADGIALGASSTTSSSNLSFIIFLALMLHKAPAAFGLTSVLLKQGLSKRAARAHLIVFSLAAPVGALLTWSAAHLLGYSTSALSSSVSTEFATGVLLLFSGGTFLYVAMHTMQDSSQEGHGEAQGNGYVGVPIDMYSTSVGPPPEAQKAGSVTDTVVCVVGMLIPLLTQVGHAH
jgi:zinc transporter 9